MLKTRLCLPSKVRLWNFQPRTATRSFFSATKPISFRRLKPNVGGSKIAERVNKSRVTTLFQALKSSIDSTNDHELIVSRVKDNLDRFIPLISRPHDAYENVIRFLIKRTCLPAAVAVYERMVTEGFIVSPSVEAQMIVVAMGIADKKTKKELISSLKAVVRNQLFTDDDLFGLLSSMVELELSPVIFNVIVDEFYKTHHSAEEFDPDLGFYKKLVYSGIQSSNIGQALDTLSALPGSSINEDNMAEAYASFIAGIRDTRHWDRETVSDVLGLMEKQGIEPGIGVFNALISYEVRTNSLRRAFAIYHALKNHPKLLPDDFTFGSLFNVLNRLYNPKRRKYRHDRHLPDDIPTPRALYRDMISALVRHPRAPSFQLTTSLLNVVLRSFIYKTDYVGAYIAIRCFTSFHVPMNFKTYLIVFRHLMNRITYGIRAFRKMGDDKWADRFLSLPYPIHDPSFLSGLELSNALAARILEVSRRSSFKLDWPLYITAGAPHEQVPEKYHVPTVENMLGRDPVPVDQPFDPVPLERLLKKAILAESDSMRQLGHGKGANSYISKVIADAKDEMIPPGVSRPLKRMLRRREMLKLAYLI